jgi:cytidine deaminase
MDLLDQARAAREKAYARYSGFKVGAAVRGASGRVYVGCNVENAAYPEGTCAETGAIAAMVAAGETALTEVAIIADSPAPISPCGGCRQRLAEFGGGETLVIMATLDGQQATARLGELLPGAFSSVSLPRG